MAGLNPPDFDFKGELYISHSLDIFSYTQLLDRYFYSCCHRKGIPTTPVLRIFYSTLSQNNSFAFGILHYRKDSAWGTDLQMTV